MPDYGPGRTPNIGLAYGSDAGRNYNWDLLDTVISGAAAGALPDASVTTAKLAPSATIPATFAIDAPVLDLAATETLIVEWTVQAMTGRPILTLVSASLEITNLLGGIQNATTTVLSLRLGGTYGGVDGGLIKATAPIRVSQPQNAAVDVFPQLMWLTPIQSGGPIRYSLTGQNPNADKNKVTVLSCDGIAIIFA